jgi:exodeoxyribonuclease-3
MEFLHDFNRWIKLVLKEGKPVIVMGDYNIAHTEIDIHDPVRNKKTSGFLPEEREWLSNWFDRGFTDSFRFLHPEKIEYSWWTYRAGARANNKGWRIDYISVTESLREKLTNAGQLQDAFHSDHCPVMVEFNLS